MPSPPSTRTFNPSATNRQSLAFDYSSSFLSPDTANTVGNPSDATATLTQTARQTQSRRQRRASDFCTGTHLERRVGPQSTDFSGLSAGSAFRSPRPDATVPGGLDGLSPVVGDSWASMVNTPLLPMFQKTSSANNNQPTSPPPIIPRLDGLDEFRRPSNGRVHDSSRGSNNGGTNNGMYGDDGDLIQGHYAPGVGHVQSGSSRGQRNGGGGTWSGAQSPALSNTSGGFGGNDDGSNAMAAAHQQAALTDLGMGVSGFSLGLGSPGLAGMQGSIWRNSRSWMASIRITSEAQLLAARIAAAGGGFGQPGLGLGAGLGSFGGLQGGIGGNGLCGGSGRSGGRSPGRGGGSASGGSARNGGAKKNEEDFKPSVLNDVVGWLRTLRLHKYTSNFECMTWKEMVVMDEQVLEAQGVARSVRAGRCSRLSGWFAGRWASTT
ncbi:hypothetical protein EDB85DRAFT_2223722 [Lactarius pseudohatsudake]|nr:hypothetical protein EDB85DRAFT_2223722 [Lactarius pseudohatsudake]